MGILLVPFSLTGFGLSSHSCFTGLVLFFVTSSPVFDNCFAFFSFLILSPLHFGHPIHIRALCRRRHTSQSTRTQASSSSSHIGVPRIWETPPAENDIASDTTCAKIL